MTLLMACSSASEGIGIGVMAFGFSVGAAVLIWVIKR